MSEVQKPVVPGQGAPSGRSVESQRHIAQAAHKHARANALTADEIMQVSAAARQAHYKTALASGKPTDTEAAVRAAHSAVEQARDIKMRGAT